MKKDSAFLSALTQTETGYMIMLRDMSGNYLNSSQVSDNYF